MQRWGIWNTWKVRKEVDRTNLKVEEILAEKGKTEAVEWLEKVGKT